MDSSGPDNAGQQASDAPSSEAGAPEVAAARAVCGAYLMVAFADRRFEPSEEKRFLASIANQPALLCVCAAQLTSAWNALIEAFSADYRAAAVNAVQAIEAIRDRAESVNAVKIAAQAAIVADARISPQEEIAVDRVAMALGLPPGSL